MLKLILLTNSKKFFASDLISILLFKIFQICETILLQVKVDVVLIASLIKIEVISIIAIVMFLSLF